MEKFIGIVIVILTFYIGLIIGMVCFNYQSTTITTKNRVTDTQKVEVEKAIDYFDFGFEYEEHYM